MLALVILLLDAAGVAPPPAKLLQMEDDYRQRGHHVFLDFGTTRQGSPTGLTIGLGYEYYVDRRFNGVSFEVYGQKVGDMFSGPQSWWVGGGLGYHPVRPLKVFMHAGALFEDGRTSTTGRVGLGYALQFFVINVMPYAYVQTTDDGVFSWSFAARIMY